MSPVSEALTLAPCATRGPALEEQELFYRRESHRQRRPLGISACTLVSVMLTNREVICDE